MELFSRTELVQAEALRRHKAAQLPGQLDLVDDCAELEAGVDAWPQPFGVLYDAQELRGQLVIA